MKNKKITLGVCIGLAATGVVAGTCGVIFGIQSKKPEADRTQGDYTLSFSAGQGKFVSDNNKQKVFRGTTLDRVAQPIVEMYSPWRKEQFIGWTDETGALVPGQMSVTRDMKLTAAFTNGAIVGEYHTITFMQSSEWTLQGNTSIAVKDLTQFFMVNRPEATATKKTFKGWKYAKKVGTHEVDEVVQETDKFTADTWLKPYFENAVTVTWDLDEANGGRLVHGTTTTQMPVNSTFSQFNQPYIINADGSKYFTKWYYKDTYQAVNAGDIISKDTTVIAGWGDPTVQEGYSMVKFIPNETSGQPTDITIAPSTYSVISKWKDPATKQQLSTWSDVNRPTITANTGYWEMDENNPWQISSDEKRSWTNLTASYQFNSSINYFYVRPVMQSAIKKVAISGDTNVLPESVNTYTAKITGGKMNDVSWKLYSDEACQNELPTNIAEVKYDSTTGAKVTVKFLTAATTFYLKATSNFDSTKSEKITITVTMPYEWEENSFNKQVWFNKDSHWYYFNTSELCETTAKTISATALEADRAPLEILRTTTGTTAGFTSELFVGRAEDFTAIPDQFMYGFTNFGGSLNFGNNITTIGSSFLEKCTHFSADLTNALANITSIGSNFLYQCTSFNQPITLNSNLTTIGDRFMSLCTSFNSALTLPTTASSLTIGERFLSGCTSFNQNLIIPSCTTQILDFFMTDCTNFTSTLTINCALTDDKPIFAKNQHDISASTVGNYGVDTGITLHPIYETGFTVAGTGAEKFKSFYTNKSSDTIYRTIKDESTWYNPTDAEYTAALNEIFTTTTPNFTVNAAWGAGAISYETLYVDTKNPTVAANKTRIYKSSINNSDKSDKYTYEDTKTHRFYETTRGSNNFSDLVLFDETDWSKNFLSIYTQFIQGKAHTYDSTRGLVVVTAPEGNIGHAEIKFNQTTKKIDSINIVPAGSTGTIVTHGNFVFSNYGTTNIDVPTINRTTSLNYDYVMAQSNIHEFNCAAMGMEANAKYGITFNLTTTTSEFPTFLPKANRLTISLPDADETSPTAIWNTAPKFTVQILNQDGTAKTAESQEFEFALSTSESGERTILEPKTVTFDDIGLTTTLTSTDNVLIRLNRGSKNTIKNIYMNVLVWQSK